MGLIDILDLLGTFVFAVSGAFRATRHSLDFLGVMVLAVTTGIGGGLIRDMLLGATPAAAITSELYLGVCILGGLVVWVGAAHVATQWNRVMIADAIGLGVFAAIGAAKGAAFGLGPIGVAIMAALTATGGGVVRDLLVQEIPAVVKQDFYATATLIGAAVFLGMEALEFSLAVQIWSTAVVTSGLRFFAMFHGVNLPRIDSISQD
jgi:uncharacterized membrane protein YeiH